MAIVLSCECGVNIRVEEAARGHKVRCPQCGAIQTVDKHAKSVNKTAKAHTLEVEDTDGVMFEALQEHAGPRQCPVCEALIAGTDVVCPKCGHNTETGMTLTEQDYRRSRNRYLPLWLVASAGVVKDLIRKFSPVGVIPTITGSSIVVGAILALMIGGWWWAATEKGKSEYIQQEVPRLLAMHVQDTYKQGVNGLLLETIKVENLNFATSNDGSGHQTFVGDMTVISETKRLHIGRLEGEYHPGFMWFNVKITDNLITADFELSDPFFKTFGVTRPEEQGEI